MTRSKRGSITQLSDGRWWARAPQSSDGVRSSLGVWPTETKASRVLAAALYHLDTVGVSPTWDAVADAWHGALEGAHSRSATAYGVTLRRIRRLADWTTAPITAITTRDLQEWLGALITSRLLSVSSLRTTATVTRMVFDAAVDSGHLTHNPMRDVRTRLRPPIRTPEHLTLEEQSRLLACTDIPVDWRLLYAYGLGTGCRPSEMTCQRLTDVHRNAATPHIVVSHGSPAGPPKSGQARTIPMLPIVERTLDTWAPVLATRPNPHNLLWPSTRGGFRLMHTQFRAHLRAAGITRHVTPHALRHTCAVSLLNGWYGRAWRLEEVQALLGHASVKQTQVYARLSATSLALAARETVTTPAVTPPQNTRLLQHATGTGCSSDPTRSAYETSPIDADASGYVTASDDTAAYLALLEDLAFPLPRLSDTDITRQRSALRRSTQ